MEKTDDLGTFLEGNPAEILKCAKLVQIVDLNKSMMELIEGESKDELLGSLLKHMTLPASILNFKDSLIALTKGKTQIFVSGHTVSKKGKILHLKYLTYISDEYISTWEEAWVLVFDLTEYMEKETLFKERIHKNEFLIDLMTHDLKNIMAQTKGFIEIVQYSTIENHTFFLQKAKSSVDKATKLLNDISVLMKSQIAKEYVLEPTNLKNVLVSAKDFILNLYSDQNVQVLLEKIPDDFSVIADSLIEQIFINLFSNAVKHNDNEVKKIKVTCSKKGNHCSISIADNARGIPENVREKIFKRYSEFKTTGRGSGLGLSIVNTLVRRYNAQISIKNRKSDNYSKGSVFTLKLPRIL